MNSYRASIFLAFVLTTAIRAVTQSAATADLHVTVKDSQGATVTSATVQVQDSRSFTRHCRTNNEGRCSFISVPPDRYVVRVNAAGFAETVSDAVSVTVGQVAELSATLQLPSHSEAVNVSAQPGMVEIQRTSAATTIDSIRIDSLPINGRNYVQHALTDSRLTRDASPIVGAAPTSGLNFGGQRARSNLVNVDGADAVDNSTNGIRSTVSQEAVQEFQVLTSSFSAEYGRAAGGVVNVITKSGTNDFHGSAFGFLRNRRLQSANPFSTVADPAYTRVQTGLSAGGPLRKNKTFYFFSYEGTRRRETGFSNIGFNNFGLMPFDTAPLAPLLGMGGASFGTILLTPQQVRFTSDLAAAIPKLTLVQQAAFLPAIQNFLVPYLTLAGGGSGIALNGTLPTAAMLPVVTAIASRNSLPAPLSRNVFPSSGAVLPPGFVTLNSAKGNYPVSEATDLYSLRLDHLLTNNRAGSLRVGFSRSLVSGIQNTYAGANSGQSAASRSTEQKFRDWTVAAQHIWVVSPNHVNEFRFQYAYRGLRYDPAHAPGASNPAVNIAGFAFFGREPISYVDRSEERLQAADQVSLALRAHTIKAGVEANILPMAGVYTIQFGGLYAFGELRAGSFLTDSNGRGLDQLDLTALGLGTIPVPGFNPAQAYGLGVPQSFVQGVGNPSEQFTNKVFAGFVQDSWRLRPNLTLNYGLRYDVELTPQFRAANSMSQAAEAAMGITQGIPRDLNNIAPRIGLAWDPRGGGKTVLRASYGLFYDHPLMALAFTSDVADGTQAPLVALSGGAPGCGSSNKNLLNATNAFQGWLRCLPPQFNYLPDEQRFNPAPNAPSVFVAQQYMATGTPLIMQPFTMPVARKFQYAYANQAKLAVERELAKNLSLEVEYSFTGGRHLIRPIDRNSPRGELTKLNYDRALAAVNALAAAGVPSNVTNQLRPADPLTVAICPEMLRGLGLPPVWGAANFTPAALVSFFRPSGINPSLLLPSSPFAACAGSANIALQEFGLGVGVPVPFSGVAANYSDGSSAYHGLTASLRKRMSSHTEFLASYTWSQAMDDGSIELQTGLGPQDAHHPELERGHSLFDQRHRFVFSGVFLPGKRFSRGIARILNGWTLAPIVDISSGRPFNIVTYTDRNFDLTAVNDRPMVVPGGTAANACGDPAVASRFSPTGFFQLPCYQDPLPRFSGNLARNAGMKPWTVFTDVRISRTLALGDRVTLDAMLDVFNLINRFNVADVDPLYTDAGSPTAAFDKRQFQFALRLRW